MCILDNALRGTLPDKRTVRGIVLVVHFRKEPGYRASAKVIVSKRENVLLLPYEAILQDKEGEEYVLSVQDDLILRRNILTGAELETQVEVLEGMEADTWVLQNPKAEWEGEEMLFVAP